MSRRALLLLAVLATCAECRRPGGGAARGGPLLAAEPIVVRNAGFERPESVFHDPFSDVYFVSNAPADSRAAGSRGFISAVSAEGKVLALKWIDGAADSVSLHAPKGMAATGDFLFVADIDRVRRFDRKTGGPRGEVLIPGATWLCGMAAGDDGSVYFTDAGLRDGAGGPEPSGTDAVYRIEPGGRLDTLARGATLGRPTAVSVSGDSVWVVAAGSGELYRVANGGTTDVVKLPKGGLDGLVVLNGEAFVASRESRSIFRGPLSGPFTEILTGIGIPGGLGHDLWRHRLLIAAPADDKIRIVPLTP
jgi:hypothetical protein